MSEDPDSFQGGHIHRPTVRLPPFWPDRPGLWFAQAEGQFELSSVTSERTKFNYVISQLEYRHAAEVEDIIMSPPANDPYTTGRFRRAYIPVPAPTHRHRLPTSDIRRLQILPYGSRSLHTLAGSHSTAGHYGRDGSPRPAVRMDNPLQRLRIRPVSLRN